MQYYSELKSKQTTLFDVTVLATLMLGATLLSVLFLIHQSLRLDEAQSLWQTAHGVPTILKIVAKDVHVPLYHILLHFWQVAFGNSIADARIFSLIFFVLTIPAIFLLGKEAFGRKVGLFAATLTALSPFLNWYGSEARMYSLLVFVTVLNQLFFIKILKTRKQSNYWGYGITALLGIFTHYFFLFALLSQVIFFFVNKKEFSDDALKHFGKIAVILFVCFLPWMYLVFHSGSASQTQPLITKPTTYNFFNTINVFFFGFQGSDLTKILISLWPMSFLFLVFSLRKDRRNDERRKIPSATGYFLLAGIMPMILVFFISFIKPSYLDRYLIFSVPSLFIFFGWVVAMYPPKTKRFVIAILFLLMALSLGHEVSSATTPVKEDYRAAVDYLQEKTNLQDVIVVSAPFTIYPIEYYYHGATAIQTLPEWNRYETTGIPAFSEQQLPGDIDKLKNQYRVAWFLLSYDQGYNEKIRDYMDQHFERVDQKSFSPNVTLYAYKLRYD